MKTLLGVFISVLFVVGAPAAPAHERGALAHAQGLANDHDFDGATRALSTIVAGAPRNGAAWLQLASVRLVQGQTDAAREACRRTAGLLDPLATLACHGRIALATGVSERAARPLLTLIEAPQYADRSDLVVSWAAGVAAELAGAVGDTATADRLFRRALAGPGASTQVRAAYVRHLLATKRARDALAQIPSDSSEPALNILRIGALQALGRDAAALIDSLNDEFTAAIAAGDYLHAREMAEFYLDIRHDPQLARTLAQRNLLAQREPEDQRLLLRAHAGQ